MDANCTVNSGSTSHVVKDLNFKVHDLRKRVAQVNAEIKQKEDEIFSIKSKIEALKGETSGQLPVLFRSTSGRI